MPVRKCAKCGRDIRCLRCDGAGYIRQKIMGVVVKEDECPKCKGTGKQRYHRCPKDGGGKTPRVIPSGGIQVNNYNKIINKK